MIEKSILKLVFKGERTLYVEYRRKGDDPMDKNQLLKECNQASRGNFFSLEIPANSIADGEDIEQMARQLEKEGKIKIRDCVHNDTFVYVHGIVKYASN
ncbi:hypothetical protein A6P54_10990 [Bacillus sp. MKU004]|nr:hypothetical protein A6P54_10990 [Bacillus sp. MKU004]QTC41713.1 hypothetical protein I7V34_00050 [Bacillus sp. V3]